MISSRPRRFAARVALALLMAGTVLAAPIVAFADSSKQPAITEARVDGAVLHVLGLNLGGGKPKVILGTLPLSVVSMTATQIDALIPASVVPGSYLITVSLAKGKEGDDRNDDFGKYDEFWVTIGAVGSRGPAGLNGVDGATGAVGPQGPAGAVGATGALGPAGPIGLQGAAGAQGSTGPAGARGLAGPSGSGGTQGPPGPQGPVGAQGPMGPQGPAGSTGSPSTSVVHTVRRWRAGDGFVTATAECPAGSVLTGGSALFWGYANTSSSLSSSSENTWSASGYTEVFPDPILTTIVVSAICLRIN